MDMEAAWAAIHALMELKSSSHPRAYKSAFRELLQCARKVFAAKQSRRTSLGVMYSGDNHMAFLLLSKVGVPSSEGCNIMDEPEKLVREFSIRGRRSNCILVGHRSSHVQARLHVGVPKAIAFLFLDILDA
ncbi:hypothetical protein DFH11DRAFT_1731267 [Phellopilus nigrolimitatus]|nr:hypothetical protein DFH11DRAFT_1731267 [Phellopilus nigrolimitatus]